MHSGDCNYNVPPILITTKVKENIVTSHTASINLHNTWLFWVSSHVTSANDNWQNLVKTYVIYRMHRTRSVPPHCGRHCWALIQQSIAEQSTTAFFTAVCMRERHKMETTRLKWLWHYSGFLSHHVTQTVSCQQIIFSLSVWLSLSLLLFPHICARLPVHERNTASSQRVRGGCVE